MTGVKARVKAASGVRSGHHFGIRALTVDAGCARGQARDVGLSITHGASYSRGGTIVDDPFLTDGMAYAYDRDARVVSYAAWPCFSISCGAVLYGCWALAESVLCSKFMRCCLQRVDLMYLRAICHHALGRAVAAAADYNACMNYSPKPGRVQGEESTMYQYLSFYQRELALYVYHNLDRPVVDFSMDCEIPALFKVRRASWILTGGTSGGTSE